MKYMGDYKAGASVRIPFGTNAAAGGSATFTGTTVKVYKDYSTVERASASGITLSKDHDGVTGTHIVQVDLSDNADAGFYAAGHDYHAMLAGATIDGQTVNAWLGGWSIENRNNQVDVVKQLGADLQPSDFTIAAATSNGSGGGTVTLPATYTDGTALPDKGQLKGAVLLGLSGPGKGQLVILAAPTSTPPNGRVYTVAADTMPDAFDNTSEVVVFQTSRARADLLNVTVGTNLDKGNYTLEAAFVATTIASIASAVWANTTRTLTSLSSLTGDIATAVWTNGTRTLTSLTLTANDIADAVLLRDWTAIAGTVPGRSILNALRKLRNKWSLTEVPGYLVVKKEDDSTEAYRQAVTVDAAAEAITDMNGS